MHGIDTIAVNAKFGPDTHLIIKELTVNARRDRDLTERLKLTPRDILLLHVLLSPIIPSPGAVAENIKDYTSPGYFEKLAAFMNILDTLADIRLQKPPRYIDELKAGCTMQVHDDAPLDCYISARGKLRRAWVTRYYQVPNLLEGTVWDLWDVISLARGIDRAIHDVFEDATQ